MAGGVPEVMLHLRRMGLLDGSAMTVSGEPLDAALDWWEASARRRALREQLAAEDHVQPEAVIMSPTPFHLIIKVEHLPGMDIVLEKVSPDTPVAEARRRGEEQGQCPEEQSRGHGSFSGEGPARVDP